MSAATITRVSSSLLDAIGQVFIMGFNLKSLAVSALVAASQASPLYPRAGGNSNATYAFTNSNGLNFTQMNTTLPNVTLFATGAD